MGGPEESGILTEQGGVPGAVGGVDASWKTGGPGGTAEV